MNTERLSLSARVGVFALFLGLSGCGDSPAGPSGPEEAMQMPTSTITFRGFFHPVVRSGMGIAEVVRAADGSRMLRFRNFEIDPGPGLEVYMVAASDATDNQSVLDAGFVSLGALQSPAGDQMYAIPDDLDLGAYRAVTVWCVPFSVNFATAPLMSAGS